MDRSLDDEAYSTVSVKAHNNEYFFSEIPLMKMLEYSKDRKVPVWTELQLLEFLKARDEATFDHLTWSGSTLTFELNSSLKNDNAITFLVPARFNAKQIQGVFSNGANQPYAVKRLKGNVYAWITVQPGFDYQVEVIYR